jgi:hypothetical protein
MSTMINMTDWSSYLFKDAVRISRLSILSRSLKEGLTAVVSVRRSRFTTRIAPSTLATSRASRTAGSATTRCRSPTSTRRTPPCKTRTASGCRPSSNSSRSTASASTVRALAFRARPASVLTRPHYSRQVRLTDSACPSINSADFFFFFSLARHVNMDLWPGFCGKAGVFCIGEVFDSDVG